MLKPENVWRAVAELEKQHYTRQEIATKLRAYATHGHLTRSEYHRLITVAQELERHEPELPFSKNPANSSLRVNSSASELFDIDE